MTTTIVFADSTDGYASSTNASYATARTGSGTGSAAAATNIFVGQALSGGSYTLHEGFMRWAYAAPANEVVTSAAVRLYELSVNGPGVARDLEVRQYDYATPLTGAAWRSGSTLSGLPLLATVADIHTAELKYLFAGSSELVDLLAAGSTTLSVVLSTSRLRTGTAPTGFEQAQIAASEGAGTTNDPALIFTSVAQSTLFAVLGAQVRLSDGSHAVLESSTGTGGTVNLRRVVGVTPTTVAALPAGIVSGPGAQGLGLAVDASDNLYVVGRSSSADNSLASVKFTKGAGFTWTAGSAVATPLPAYAAGINQVAVTWHATGGAGSLFVVAGHAAGTGITGAVGNDVSYAILSATTLAATATAAAPGSIQPSTTPPSGYYSAFTNETGAALDVAASGLAGYLASTTKGTVPGDSGSLGLGRYDVGASAVSGAAHVSAASSVARKDASAKVRAVPTGTTSVAVVSADPSAGQGIAVTQYQATSSGWTAVSPVIALDGQGIASMPAASVLASSLAWDAVYVPLTNKLWIYYPDATDGRIVRRTGVDLTTYQATKEELIVSTVGAAGGTNLAVRVARNASVATSVLVTVAHRASGGALSTSYVNDPYNVAPGEPTLAPKSGFDATTAQVFSWTFNDPGDTQSAYQLVIVDSATSATVLDTGKVASTTPSRTVAAGTLANDKSYLWRVKTWDSLDLASPFSTDGTFSTGAGGSVTITDPATDNPPGIVTDDYVIHWTVTGTTQNKVRVWVTRNDTGAVVHDGGWVVHGLLYWTIAGMVSDVEHTIRVQVENGAGVRSTIATRLITPSYGTPMAPIVAASGAVSGGHILLSITNPPPIGDRPVVVTNEVWRRQAGAGEYELITTVPPNGEFRDYDAAAGVAYEYRVRGVTA